MASRSVGVPGRSGGLRAAARPRRGRWRRAARDGVWPQAAGRLLAQVHPRFGSPWAATLLAGGLAAGLCLLPLRWLLMLSGSGVTLIYVALALACLLHGPRRATTPGWRLPLWPAPPLAAVGLLAVFAVVSFKDAAASFAVSLVCAAAFALYYAMVLKPRGDWRLRGPAVDKP